MARRSVNQAQISIRAPFRETARPDTGDKCDPRGRDERLFRQLFCAGYGGLIGVSLLMELQAFAPWLHEGRAVLAALSLFGAGAAVAYRSAHPLGAKRAAPHPALSARIRAVMERDALYLDRDLKVADLARALNTADDKVTQSITGDLGHANFNQMINTYRIEAACDLLRDDTAAARSILDVAMASGFASPGPFNRAFKAQTGLTPTAFRRQAHRRRDQMLARQRIGRRDA